MERRVSGGLGTGARKPRTESTRRPHSQPERLLSVSCRNAPSSSQCDGNGNDGARLKEMGKVMHCEDSRRGHDGRAKQSEDDKVFRVFKRRDFGTRGGVFVPEEEEDHKASAAARRIDSRNKTADVNSKLKVGSVSKAMQSNPPNGKMNGGNEKWAPKLVKAADKQKPEEKLPEVKRRRHRLILEGFSDDEDSEPSGADQKDHSVEKKTSPSKLSKAEESKSKAQEPLTRPKSVGEGLVLRKSSRVVKRRAFDDEEPEVVRKRRRKVQDNSREADKFPSKASCPDVNTDSTDEELPRKRTKKGSMQELHAVKERRQRGALVRENSPVKGKPLTARQRAIQAGKEGSSQEQASTSGRDEHQKAESPDESMHDVESKDKSATPLTARQRSLQAWKEGEGDFSLIEFPEGLNTTDRKRKAKLSEEEKLAKKAEAATKRKQQVEKAAKEIQASAIQKILNQDSNRKKKEERLQKQKQELAEGKKAAELVMATNCIRWVMGPSGTTVSWSQDVGFPPLFESSPVRYPPRREKCAACDNEYKYRDSKSNLPLCSLQCYKAVQQPPMSMKAMEVAPAH